MNRSKGPEAGTPSSQSLREAAEERLAHLNDTDMLRSPSHEVAPDSDAALLHELQVHQIELEMQNNTLRGAQLELEVARDRYLDLFEFAPVGYVTLDHSGVIEEANLTVTRLLGVNRKWLLGRRFAAMIVSEDRDKWHRYFQKLTRGLETLACECRVLREHEQPFHASLSGTSVQSVFGKSAVRLTLADITDRLQLKALNESELRLRLAIEALAGGIYDWDRRGGLFYWNSASDKDDGVAPANWRPTRHSWRMRVHPGDLQRNRPDFRQVLKRRDERFNLEYRLRHDDGTWRYVSDRGLLVRDDAGRLIRLVGTITDITARKLEEDRRERSAEILEEAVTQRTAEVLEGVEALDAAERFSRGTIDSLSSRLCVLDEGGQIIATNLAWREYSHEACASMPGGRPRDCCGLPFQLACWSSETAMAVEKAIREIVAGGREVFRIEYPCNRRGVEHWFEMHITRFAGAGPIRLVVRHDEITERKRAELDRQIYASRVKQLGAHLESVREEQNALIARELHDEIGASMTMLKLGLASAAADASTGAVRAERLEGLIELVDSGLQVVKRISGNLRPATLDSLGLVATIKWYLAQFSKTTGIQSELILPDYVRLSDTANIAVFRIIQEGLTNVARHSGADQVRVKMYKHHGALILRIADNGSGVREADLERQDSFGVIGMRERAQHLDGSLEITNRASGGTCLTLQIPLHD